MTVFCSKATFDNIEIEHWDFLRSFWLVFLGQGFIFLYQ